MSKAVMALSKIENMQEKVRVLETAIALLAEYLGQDVKVHTVDGRVVKVELVEKVKQ